MKTVAIQGVRGSYSEEATRKLLGRSAEILECVDFGETFESLLMKKADFAVVPLKNKIVGEIAEAAELLRRTDLRVLEELSLEVRHVLVGTAEAGFENLRSVSSHVEALKQCGRFLSAHSQLRQIAGADTAASIRRIVEEDNPQNAAIGSRRAAEIYGARVLREDIADDPENWTLFYLIGN